MHLSMTHILRGLGLIAALALAAQGRALACEPDRAYGGTWLDRGDKPAVDHVDLIAGAITGLVDPSSPDYTKATNESTRVIASFSAKDLQVDGEGFHTVTIDLDVTRPMYLRLRGTNLPCGTPNETGRAAVLPSADHCNPLPDALAYPNDAQKAFEDLWFYSNPIFVYVK